MHKYVFFFFAFIGSTHCFSSILDNAGMGFNPAAPMNWINPANPYYGGSDDARKPSTKEIVKKCNKKQNFSDSCQKARARLEKEREERAYQQEVTQALLYIKANSIERCMEHFPPIVCSVAQEQLDRRRQIRKTMASVMLVVPILVFLYVGFKYIKTILEKLNAPTKWTFSESWNRLSVRRFFVQSCTVRTGVWEQKLLLLQVFHYFLV